MSQERRAQAAGGRIGVDTGGTFTDFVWIDEAGRLQLRKVLSTPANPAQAVIAGIEGLGARAARAVVHGSTVGTNALLERRGARTALITTRGFADVLAIGRQNRPDLYALVPRKPEPLVPGPWRFEVGERVNSRGEVLQALDVNELDGIWERMVAEGVQSVAVCLLFSFLEPRHEQLIRDDLRRRETEALESGALRSALSVSLSSEILPEFREYERTSTTVINAYIAPLITHYLADLQRGLKPRTLTVMQSSGGIISAAEAGAQAARTVLSGPAGGVVGARFVAQAAGFENVISFDMGGTSTDVALCPGRLPTTAEGEIDHMPLRLPMIDIHSVGAGGGSLARVDAGGALHVGPQSAGAEPGPACYGRPGRGVPGPDDEPGPWVTVTDANLVLGRLDAGHFLGGTMKLVTGAALEALQRLARLMGVGGPEEAAWGVIQVANANMERAIRRVTIERGHDPRDTVLVAFGGAGPLHACELAQSMDIPRVLVPAAPGVLSALGLLVARPTRDYSQTVMRRLEGDAADWPGMLGKLFDGLVVRGMADMATEGYGPKDLALHFALDMRYVGQSFELGVPWSAGEGAPAILEGFHRAHRRRYGYERPEATVELVNLRLKVEAQSDAPVLPPWPEARGPVDAARAGRKDVWFEGRPWPTDLYRRDLLGAGHEFEGPAVLFQYDTTTVVPPGWRAVVDGHGQLILSWRAQPIISRRAEPPGV
jgi:N-methylhydantoinase A